MGSRDILEDNAEDKELLVDIDFPDPPTQQEIRDSIQDSDSDSSDSDKMGQFAVVGVVMIGFLGYLFYEALKKGE